MGKVLKGFIVFAVTVYATGTIMAGAYFLAKGVHDALGW